MPTYHIVLGLGLQKEERPNQDLTVGSQLLNPIKQSITEEIKNNGQILKSRLFIKSMKEQLCKSIREANKNPDRNVKMDKEAYPIVLIT